MVSTSTRLAASPRVELQHDTFFNWHSRPPIPESVPFPQLCRLFLQLYRLRCSLLTSLRYTDSFFLNPWTPLVFGASYFALSLFLSSRQDGKNRIKGKGWDMAVLAHNIFLAAYSMWTYVTFLRTFADERLSRWVRTATDFGDGVGLQLRLYRSHHVWSVLPRIRN